MAEFAVTRNPDELVIVHAGCELRMSEGELLLRKGDTSLRLNANGIFEAADRRNTNGGRMTHNNTNIGDSHKHGGVQPGGGITSTPV